MRERTLRIAAGWKEYREHVMSPEADETQLIECKRAFYAGSFSLFREIFDLVNSEEEPSEDDLAMLDDIEQELVQYAFNVLKGKQ